MVWCLPVHLDRARWISKTFQEPRTDLLGGVVVTTQLQIIIPISNLCQKRGWGRTSPRDLHVSLHFFHSPRAPVCFLPLSSHSPVPPSRSTRNLGVRSSSNNTDIKVYEDLSDSILFLLLDMLFYQKNISLQKIFNKPITLGIVLRSL